jgi:hypothetical protein
MHMAMVRESPPVISVGVGMCEMPESTEEMGRSVRQLLFSAALMGIGYTCIHALSFTNRAFHLIFACAVYVIPFLAIRPVLRLHGRPRTWGLILLTPLLVLSSFLLLGTVVFDGLLGGSERTKPLQTFQQGSSTIQLQRYENGGAVGVRGLNLEQRRLIVPGLYVVRSVDFFDYAKEGTLSVEAPYRVRVHAKGNYYSNDYQVDKVYFLKPWVYF